MTHNGNLYNGDQLLHSSGRPIAAGAEVRLELAGDALYVEVDGEEYTASVRPVLGSVRGQLFSLSFSLSLSLSLSLPPSLSLLPAASWHVLQEIGGSVRSGVLGKFGRAR